MSHRALVIAGSLLAALLLAFSAARAAEPPLSSAAIVAADIPGVFALTGSGAFSVGHGTDGFERLFEPKEGHRDTSLVFVDEQLVRSPGGKNPPLGSVARAAHNGDLQRGMAEDIHGIFLKTVLLPPEPHVVGVKRVAAGDEAYAIQYRARTTCCNYWAVSVLITVGHYASVIKIGALAPLDDGFVLSVARKAAARIPKT